MKSIRKNACAFATTAPTIAVKSGIDDGKNNRTSSNNGNIQTYRKIFHSELTLISFAM